MATSDESRDLMAELGELALVSRLRRTADALWEETATLYADLGIDFQPRWFTVFYAIGHSDYLSISEVAGMVGLTAQGVGKIVDELVAAGLVREQTDPNDSRVRRVVLSRRGQSTLEQLDPVWQGVRSVARELMAEARIDLVEDLDRLEAALRAKSHGQRLREHFGLPEGAKIEIADYRPAYKKHFRALNEQWLQSGFTVEEHDARLLADPNGRILKRGGHILFALVRGKVVGTCALIRHGEDVYELAMMAVTPSQRNRGIGTILTAAAVERILESGAETLYLRTHPDLAAARKVYAKIGFRRIKHCPLPPPEVVRDALTMRLNAAAYQRFKDQQEKS